MLDVCEKLTFRLMTADDVPRVYELDQTFFPTPWSLATYYGEVNQPSSFMLVTCHDGIIVGFCNMRFERKYGHPMKMAVDPGFRRLGIGRMLMRAMIDEARRRQARGIILEVRASNVIAQELYLSLGYRIYKRRHRYYHNNDEDAIIMRMDFPR